MNADPYQVKTGIAGAAVDAGLRAHMLRVYNRMTVGVLVTALTAWAVSSSDMMMALIFGGPQMYLVMLAPLAIVWFGFNPATMSSSRLQGAFLLLSVVYGLSFAAIAKVFAGEDIARAFFITTAMFAGLSIFGYTTKKDLSALGTFAIMGVMGALILGVINLFVQSSGMQNIICGISIIAFSGIAAWETQATKEMYNPAYGEEINSRMAWAAALNLYISFVALFQSILHLLGNRN